MQHTFADVDWGLGSIGWPLAVAFAKKGWTVYGLVRFELLERKVTNWPQQIWGEGNLRMQWFQSLELSKMLILGKFNVDNFSHLRTRKPTAAKCDVLIDVVMDLQDFNTGVLLHTHFIDLLDKDPSKTVIATSGVAVSFSVSVGSRSFWQHQGVRFFRRSANGEIPSESSKNSRWKRKT